MFKRPKRELTAKILAIEHKDIELLESIPGIGGLTSRVIVSAIDEVKRFDSKKAVWPSMGRLPHGYIKVEG